LRRAHFEALQPVCPLCRAPLALSSIARGDAEDVLEGIVVCTGRECSREYPIVDGIPIFVGAIRGWLSANPLQLLLRNDLSAEVESLLGDVLGPGSAFDTLRQHTGIYADDHYGAGGAAALRVLARGLDATPAIEKPVLDIGCATGRTTFALAERSGALTIGVDLNFAMLRIASSALREGRVRYARRRVGVVYERREVAFASAANERVDFWCCDAAALPFGDATFGTAVSLNLVDCTPAPAEALRELGRVVRGGGTALVATPYDWSASATPVEGWLGGHSQRGPHGGAAEPILRALLAEHFTIESEEPSVPWRVRLHDRSAVEYDVHVVVGRRSSDR
jgi:SAM-dependent methyltransferase/uncharacterized protein YbaR (Trm112 family)